MTIISMIKLASTANDCLKSLETNVNVLSLSLVRDNQQPMGGGITNHSALKSM